MLDQKIETFLQVVKSKSYTNTAKILHMTQPAVTQHIRKLEEHYHCQLIDSTHRTIRLTHAGQLLYQFLSIQQANQRDFMQYLKNSNQPLKIGTTLSIADYYLPQLFIHQLIEAKERLRILVENTNSLMEKLMLGEIDCAFIEGNFAPANFESMILCEADFIPVVSIHHPLANKEVTLEDLYAYPLVLREPNSGTRTIFENRLSQRNGTINSFSQVVELGSFVLIKEVIAHSDAISFIYEGVVKKEINNQQLATLDLQQFHVTHPLVFIYRKADPREVQIQQFFTSLITNNSDIEK